MGASEVLWDLVLAQKRSGHWFKYLKAFGDAREVAFAFHYVVNRRRTEEKTQWNDAQKFGFKKIFLVCFPFR